MENKTLKVDMVIAGHDAVLELDEEAISQGDVLSGCVMITVHEDGEESVGRLILKLQEYSREVSDDDEDTLTTRTRVKTRETIELKEFEERSIVIRNSFSFQLVRARAYRFSIKLERNCRFSTDSGGWQLNVRLLNDLGVYPDAEIVKLDVQVGEELQAVLRTWELLKFKEAPKQRSWDKRALTTRFWLEPPKVLEGELDGVALVLRQSGGGALEGRVIFDLQEKSVADYIKSLLQKDLVSHDLALSRDMLVDEDGQPNLERLSQTFGTLLKQVLAER